MKFCTLTEHFLELKKRILRVFYLFCLVFIICYYFIDKICAFFLQPLMKLNQNPLRKIIYTDLPELFSTYLKLALFCSFVIILPFLAAEVYSFVIPALKKNEKKAALLMFCISPILFWLGIILVFYFVIPKAWFFFLSFEKHPADIVPIFLEARISEYFNLTIQILLVFGLIFQLPVVMILLSITKIVLVESFQQKRRMVVITSFIIAGILTPPDVISQFALAIPMILLYEVSILICKYCIN